MPKFIVDLVATAVVKVSVWVDVPDAAAAEAVALSRALVGDVVWRYDGVEDDSVVVSGVSKEIDD